jgi:hypothetical protein
MSLPKSGPVLTGTLTTRTGQPVLVRDPHTAASMLVLRIMLCLLTPVLVALLVGAWLGLLPAGS